MISADRRVTDFRNKSSESLFLIVTGSSGNEYQVTLNYEEGHWCTCKGNISKKKKFGENRSTYDKTNWCRHVVKAMESPAEALEAAFHRRQYKEDIL